MNNVLIGGLKISNIITTKLRQLQDYKFNVEFDEKSLPNLVVDEIPPIGGSTGPNPPRLLSAAVGHCLSSSLIYCLSKARVKVNAVETMIKTEIERNEKGRQRVKKIDVLIDLDVDKEDKERVLRCLKLFEDYCTVTQSIRKGIEVNVHHV
ncbi:MAG: OsmC family protein [Candidatus Bathyarchaeota archaeon]|nr:MAG: OsmC family protein [Candidatus Bathyarchaeota archaeon]